MIINTRSDLDALNDADRAQFMTLLAGSIYRIKRDDANQTWVVVEDTSTIQRFGFTRDDFPDAAPPALPEWIAPPDPRESMEVSALQGMRAIKHAGLVAGFIAWKSALDPVDDFETIAFFEKAQTWKRTNEFLIQGATALGLTDEQLDDLFALAATL